MTTGKDFRRGANRSQKLLKKRGLRFTGGASHHGPVTHIDPATIEPITPPTPVQARKTGGWAKKLRRQIKNGTVDPVTLKPNKLLIAHRMKPYQGDLPAKPEHKRPETTAKPANNKGKTPEIRA